MNDETLIFYYYDDGLSKAERREVALALRNDTDLADRYRSLVRDLDGLRYPAEAVAPEGLEHRLATSIHRAARLEALQGTKTAHSNRARTMMPKFFAWGSALAATLALGVGIGLWVAPGNSVDPHAPANGLGSPQLVLEPVQTSDTLWSPVAFQRGLESYFRSGSTNLAARPATESSDRAASYAALLNQNRLFAQLAVNHDAPDVARVLRSFEPALLMLSSKDISPEEAAILQKRLEFEFAVMLTKLSRGSSQQSNNHNQDVTL